MAFENPYQAQIDDLTAKIKENEALLDDPELGTLAAQEIERLQTQLETLQTAADDLESAMSDEPDPDKPPTNCIIEIRAGAGGDEAKIWAQDLLRMYLRFSETLGLKLSVVDDTVIKLSGTSDYLLEWFEKKYEHNDEQLQLLERLQTAAERTNPFPRTAYAIFTAESGVHRVQRVPETESQGRIHTSTASVATLPEVHPGQVEIRDEDLEWQFMRASGAGGQSVNKTNSAVRLIHEPTGITVTSRQEKKQSQNRKIALDLLRSQLWEIQEAERLEKIDKARAKSGRGRRSEKIRTYNYPQNRVTDHRINESWYELEGILEGAMESVVLETYLGLEAAADDADDATADDTPSDND